MQKTILALLLTVVVGMLLPVKESHAAKQ